MELTRAKKITDLITLPEEKRNELELQFDNFKQPGVKKELFATAQLIHNLLFLVPGTYPSTPEMGVDIASYTFEFMTQSELRSLQNKIQDQIDKYIRPTNNIRCVVDIYVDPNSKAKNLALAFGLGTDSNDTNFFMLFGRDESRNIVSQVLY